MGDQLGKKEQSGGIVDSPPKPCPFGSGLKKFAFDPSVVIFSKIQKKYNWCFDPVLR